MKKELRRSGSQVNYAQRNTLQGTQYRDNYNSQRKQYQQMSSGYYMHTANAVARDYIYEEEPQKKVQKKTVVKRPTNLARQVSTLLIVFFLGMSLVVQYAYIQNLGYEVSQAKTELKNVQEQNEKMKKQIAALGELQNVEAVAIYNMGMHKPESGEIIYLPHTAQTTAEAAAEDSAAEQAVAQVQEALGTIMH